MTYTWRLKLPTQPASKVFLKLATCFVYNRQLLSVRHSAVGQCRGNSNARLQVQTGLRAPRGGDCGIAGQPLGLPVLPLTGVRA